VDHVEREIAETIPGAHVVVHAEPTQDCVDASRCVSSGKARDLLSHHTES
jgi:hypothetical protein